MNTQETVREARARQQMVTQPNWTTRLINSSQLKSKQNYQRNINTAFVQKIVSEFLIVTVNTISLTDSIRLQLWRLQTVISQSMLYVSFIRV